MIHLTKPHRDRRCYDGVIGEGWRRISKDGTFRFANTKWGDAKLKEFAGQFLYILANDYMLTDVIVWLDGHRLGRMLYLNSETMGYHRAMTNDFDS